ncbi:hypothetical protein EDD17DRAFT_1511724 [Pisolithus thermaeus]|nr:hypothetical protein EDD17DRAFT_1511724 [Pisolithus thermaeus]
MVWDGHPFWKWVQWIMVGDRCPSILEVGLMDHAGGWRMAFHPDLESGIGGLYLAVDTHPGSGNFSSESSVSVPWWGMEFLPESEVSGSQWRNSPLKMGSLNHGREDFPLEMGLVDHHGEGGFPPENGDQCTFPGTGSILDVFPPESRVNGLWSGVDFLPESGNMVREDFPLKLGPVEHGISGPWTWEDLTPEMRNGGGWTSLLEVGSVKHAWG